MKLRKFGLLLRNRVFQKSMEQIITFITISNSYAEIWTTLKHSNNGKIALLHICEEKRNISGLPQASVRWDKNNRSVSEVLLRWLSHWLHRDCVCDHLFGLPIPRLIQNLNHLLRKGYIKFWENFVHYRQKYLMFFLKKLLLIVES